MVPVSSALFPCWILEHTLNGGVVTLVSPRGVNRIHLGKGLDERFECQQASRHAQVVSIGDKGRAHNQTDDGPA